MIEVKERAERQRRRWIEAYRVLGDAGMVCRRFGVSRPPFVSGCDDMIGKAKRACAREVAAPITLRH